MSALFIIMRNGGERMFITREMMIRKLSDKSGYNQKDIRALLKSFDEVVYDCFDEVTDDEEIMVQLLRGIRVGCSVQPERQRKDPRTQEDIIVGETVKPFCRFSEGFRQLIQEQYEAKKDD